MDRRDIIGGSAARLSGRAPDLTGVEPSLANGRRQIGGAAAIVDIISIALAGQGHMRLVMKIIRPDRVQAPATGAGGAHQAWVIPVVFRNQHDVPTRRQRRVYPRSQFGGDMGR